MNDRIKKHIEILWKKIKLKPYKWAAWIAIFFLIIPLIIFACYWIGDNYVVLIKTSLSVGDALGFYGSLLAFLGTVSLGALALWQNQRFKEESDKSQEELKNIYRKLLHIEHKRDVENLRNQYFAYIQESNKIYSLDYIFQSMTGSNSLLNCGTNIETLLTNLETMESKLVLEDPFLEDYSFFEFCNNNLYEMLRICTESDNAISEIGALCKDTLKEYEEKKHLFFRQLIKHLK